MGGSSNAVNAVETNGTGKQLLWWLLAISVAIVGFAGSLWVNSVSAAMTENDRRHAASDLAIARIELKLESQREQLTEILAEIKRKQTVK